MGAIILATLLEAAPADVRAEFEHLGSCVLGDLAAAQAGALLEGLSSDRQGLWTACKNAGISRKQGGRSLQQEELRALAKDKLLAVLPAVSFQALLDYAVHGEMGRELHGRVRIFLRDASQVETGKFAEVAATLFCVSASELEVLRNKLRNGGPLTFFALEANVNGGETKITPALQGFRYETATGIHAAALANQETALWDANTATLLTQEWQPHNAAKDYASVLGQLSACALLDCHAQAQQETEYLHGRVFQLNNVHIPFPPPEHLYEDRIYWTARIRDFSGCLDVGIRQKAASHLAGLDPSGKEAVQEFGSHCAADTLSWPLLASVKILATVRDADVAATSSRQPVRNEADALCCGGSRRTRLEARGHAASFVSLAGVDADSTKRRCFGHREAVRVDDKQFWSFSSGAKGCGCTPSRLTSNIISCGASGCGCTPGRFP